MHDFGEKEEGVGGCRPMPRPGQKHNAIYRFEYYMIAVVVRGDRPSFCALVRSSPRTDLARD